MKKSLLLKTIQSSEINKIFNKISIVESGTRINSKNKKINFERFIFQKKKQILIFEFLSFTPFDKTIDGIVLYTGLVPFKTIYFNEYVSIDDFFNTEFVELLKKNKYLNESITFTLLTLSQLIVGVLSSFFLLKWAAAIIISGRDERNAELYAERRLNEFLFKNQTKNEPAFEVYRTTISCIKSLINKQSRGMILYGPSGTSKCLGKGTKVLMFDGSILNVEDIKPKDILMGPDSKGRNVLSVSQGIGPLYKITPIKGDPYIVNDEHILSLKYKEKDRDECLINISIKDFLNKSTNFQTKAKGWRTGVEFKKQKIELNPYFLGLWLGDGTTGRPVITTADSEVVEFLKEFAISYHLQLNDMNNVNNGRKARSYLLTEGRTGGRINPITNQLKKLNILNSKRIPREYLCNSRNIRLKLLAGLIDSDGTLSCNGFGFSTNSKELFEDVLFLCRSLGFAANGGLKKNACVYKGKRIPFNHYTIHISGNVSEIPTIIKRKKASKRLQIKNPLRTGIIVEPIGEGEYFGFEIDGDRLFLLSDFTVTHNTYIVRRTLHFEKLNPGVDYTIAKGSSASKELNIQIIYSTLYNSNGKIIIFDDFDSALEDSDVINLLKAALDSYPVRIVAMPQLGTYDTGGSPLPSKFEFTGRIILITNKDVIDPALLSRSHSIKVSFTEAEFLKNIKEMIEFINPETSISTKKEVFEFVEDLMLKDPNVKIDFRKFSGIIDLRIAYPKEWKEIAYTLLKQDK